MRRQAAEARNRDAALRMIDYTWTRRLRVGSRLQWRKPVDIPVLDSIMLEFFERRQRFARIRRCAVTDLHEEQPHLHAPTDRQ